MGVTPTEHRVKRTCLEGLEERANRVGELEDTRKRGDHRRERGGLE